MTEENESNASWLWIAPLALVGLTLAFHNTGGFQVGEDNEKCYSSNGDVVCFQEAKDLLCDGDNCNNLHEKHPNVDGEDFATYMPENSCNINRSENPNAICMSMSIGQPVSCNWALFPWETKKCWREVDVPMKKIDATNKTASEIAENPDNEVEDYPKRDYGGLYTITVN